VSLSRWGMAKNNCDVILVLNTDIGMSFYVYYVYIPAPEVPEVSMESVVT